MERWQNQAASGKEWLVDQAIDFIISHPETTCSLFDMQIPEKYLAEAVAQVADGAIPIIAANHQSHIDMFPLAKFGYLFLTKTNQRIATGSFERKELLKEMVTPMAASVTTGDQNRFITVFQDRLQPWLAEQHNRMLPIVRKKDEQAYGLDPNKSIRARKALLRQARQNGSTIFLEGSVQGGRKLAKSRHPQGLIEINEPTLLSHLVLHEAKLPAAKSRQIIVLPLGLSGGYKLFSPDRLAPTPSSLMAFAHNLARPDSPIHPAVARVGAPFGLNEMLAALERNPDNPHQAINHFALEKISRLIPVQERGFLSP